MSKSPVVEVLECCHADTCLPDYWSGHHKAHISVPVYKGMKVKALKDALHSELNMGAVAGNDERTHDNSGAVGDLWYKRAHAAVNRIRPAKANARTLFNDISDSADGECEVYAYFVFTEK